jgi:dipeptidyl aminopeptidase/acylaminoacyl peptidase
MYRFGDMVGIVMRLSVLWFALLFLSGCAPMKEVRVWRPTGGRGVFGPFFSPDGKHIAYVARPLGEKEYDIFISLPDGTGERNLTQHPARDGHPVWSLDGQFIYFESNRDGHGEIYKMWIDGTELKNISQNPANDQSFDLSPDGNKIIFERRNPKAYKEVELVIASADGANQRVLVKGGWRAQWSPDGQWILHSRVGDGRGAWIIYPDGSGERRIELDKHFGWPLVWTPDSQAIFASVRGARCDKYLCPSDVYLIDLDGTKGKLVLQDVDTDWVKPPNFRCSWDSTGSRLALAMNTLERINGDLKRNGVVIFDRLGNILADFRSHQFQHDYFNLCWSPDSKTFFFTKRPWLGETKGGIYAMNDDGTGERQVVPDNIVWSSAPETGEKLPTRIKEMQK